MGPLPGRASVHTTLGMKAKFMIYSVLFFEKNVNHCYSFLPEGLKTCQLTDQFDWTSKYC